MMTVKVLQLRLIVTELKEVFDNLEQYLSIVEEYDPNTQKSLQVHRAIDRDTACWTPVSRGEEG
jgi:hypothetical protein